MGDPPFYQKDGHAVAAARDRLKAVEAELAEAYARWETLEAIEAGDGES
jgi:ATP-binding cassette subfamily F protein uup